MHTDRLKNSILIYCDGACKGNPGPGGWGAIVAIPNGKVIELGGGKDHTTNNQMELSAIVAGLRKAMDNPSPILVLSDSTYALNAIRQSLVRWSKNGWLTTTGTRVANIEIWQEILGLIEQRKSIGPLDWQHVRGHHGIPGNERADAIAVAFAEKRQPNLYNGPVNEYPVDLYTLTPTTLVAASSRSAKSLWYISYVDGQLLRHKTWAECQARVNGRNNVRYRKITSQAMEDEILAAWNLDKKQ